MQYPTSFFSFARRPALALASVLAIASVVQACSDDGVPNSIITTDAGKSNDASATTDGDSSITPNDGGGDASTTSDASPDAADSH